MTQLSTCHPERTAHGRGLCRACYGRAHRRGLGPRIHPIPSCHPDAKYAGRDLCERCYAKLFREGHVSTKKATCHPERQHCARGMCRPCYMAKWERKNPHTPKPASQFKAYRVAVRRRVLSHYSDGVPACACCDERTYEFLTIDHIHGGGKQHLVNGRRALGHALYRWLIRNAFPSGFQVLCMSCNGAKGWYGECPHVAEREGRPSPIADTETQRQRVRVIAHYSQGTMACACCSEPRYRFLAIDHIDGRQGQHIGKRPAASTRLVKWLLARRFPSGYRILCHNCNHARTRHAGVCPHEVARARAAIHSVEANVG